jgi:hypothetical protein
MGIGLGNIEYHMAQNGIYPTGNFVNIHNWWMEILVSSGIIVFGLYCWIYIKNLVHLFKFSNTLNDKNVKHIAKVFAGFLCGFIIASNGPSSLIHSEWIWPGMAVIMSFVNLFPRGYFTNISNDVHTDSSARFSE